jgi:hypothetical protein
MDTQTDGAKLVGACLNLFTLIRKGRQKVRGHAFPPCKGTEKLESFVCPHLSYSVATCNILGLRGVIGSLFL